MNKLAVALAADSAVTTGLPGREKIFTSANKIFTLSKHAPVGVMIYGHVEHFGVPWETIIKQFREILGRERLGSIAEYADRFQEYFSQRKILAERQQELSILVACASTYGTLQKIAKKRNLKWNSAGIHQALQHVTEIAIKCDFIEEFRNITYNKFARKYNSIMEAFISDKDDSFGVDLPRDQRTEFKRLVHLSMQTRMRSSFSSGIVIAGFGEDELFPSLKEIQVDGGMFNLVRVMDGRFFDVGRSGASVFVDAFAQEDVVKAFMMGYDSKYQKYMIDMLSVFMEQYTKEIFEQHANYSQDELKMIVRMLKDKLKSSVDDFRKELRKFCKVHYVLPVEDVLRAAPKDELAHVAEALVSLTSLKRRVSGERETVGGPVDVAVISKGDGFIWIKRKHYFSQELNPHFVQSYLTGETSQ